MRVFLSSLLLIVYALCVRYNLRLFSSLSGRANQTALETFPPSFVSHLFIQLFSVFI